MQDLYHQQDDLRKPAKEPDAEEPTAPARETAEALSFK